jgi:LPS export ABC transporter protein LptC
MKRHAQTLSILVIILFIFLLRPFSQAIPQEPEQTVSDFNLSGYGEGGERVWEISGKSADIFSDEITLDDFVGTLYGQEKIKVTADKGNFDRNQDRVHLEDNVIITTESGTELTTDYLDWDKQTSKVSTDAPVDIKKDNLNLSGVGIDGDTELRNVDLKSEVKLQIDDKEQKNRTVITCSGPLNINYADNIAVFNDNVFVDNGESQMFADLMEVYFDVSESDDSSTSGSFAGKSGKIKKIIARGNVKIVRGDNYSISDESVYSVEDKTITLMGKPQLVTYPAPSTE